MPPTTRARRAVPAAARSRHATWPTRSPPPAWPEHPARLVLVQAGADDIDFAACLENELVRVLGFDIGFGNTCVINGAVTPDVAPKLAAVRASLAATIERCRPPPRRWPSSTTTSPFP